MAGQQHPLSFGHPISPLMLSQSIPETPQPQDRNGQTATLYVEDLNWIGTTSSFRLFETFPEEIRGLTRHAHGLSSETPRC